MQEQWLVALPIQEYKLRLFAVGDIRSTARAPVSKADIEGFTEWRV